MSPRKPPPTAPGKGFALKQKRADEREEKLRRVREMVESGELVIRHDPTIVRPKKGRKE